jgi:N-dimethylarginine dimethylaminohydrolase
LTDEKVRENRIRRMAERQACRLEKSRRRDPNAIDYGGYMLIDSERNTIVVGGSPRPYTATLDEIEAWLTGGRKRKNTRPRTR